MWISVEGVYMCVCGVCGMCLETNDNPAVEISLPYNTTDTLSHTHTFILFFVVFALRKSKFMNIK